MGRFLEHSRIFYFHNDGEPETYIGSADWMRRNLDDRVEVLVPVEDEKARKRLCAHARVLPGRQPPGLGPGPDGRYTLRQPADDEPRHAPSTTR